MLDRGWEREKTREFSAVRGEIIGILLSIVDREAGDRADPLSLLLLDSAANRFFLSMLGTYNMVTEAGLVLNFRFLSDLVRRCQVPNSGLAPTSSRCLFAGCLRVREPGEEHLEVGATLLKGAPAFLS